MGGGTRANPQRVEFVFSYGESEGWPAGGLREGEDVLQGFVRHLREREWEPTGPAEDDGGYGPAFRTVAELAAFVRDNYMGDPDQPVEVVELPFAKLAALMAGGWTFVLGTFHEFVGNHNDTEIEVVLERAAHASGGEEADPAASGDPGGGRKKRSTRTRNSKRI